MKETWIDVTSHSIQLSTRKEISSLSTRRRVADCDEAALDSVPDIISIQYFFRYLADCGGKMQACSR